MRLQDKRGDFFFLILLDLNSYIGQLATSLQKSLLSFIPAFSLVDADLLRCLYETNDLPLEPNTDNLVNPVVLRCLYETDASSVGPKAVYLVNTDLLQQLASYPGC